MAIIETINDDYHFWNWIKHSDSYGNNFTLEGAKALQEYLEQYSDDIGENIEFDPIAWCVEFSEFETLGEAYMQYTGEDRIADTEQMLEYFTDNTSVIELDNGGIVIQDF